MKFPLNPSDIKKFRQTTDNIFVMKHNNKDYIYTSLGKLINDYDMHTFNNIQYTVHQHFFNSCYQYFEINCAEYIFAYDDINIYTAWEVDRDYVPSHNDFKYNIKNLLVDCLLGNIDCANSKNYLVLNTDKSTSRMMIMKGCGMFNTSGYRKPMFNKTQEPFEYLGIISEIMHTIPNIQKMDATQIRSLLNCNDFLIKLRDFPMFVSEIHYNYDKFLTRNLNIDTDTNEYNDLKNMINDIMVILHSRVKYFTSKIDDVLENIVELIRDIDITQSDDVVSGGDTQLNLQTIQFTTKFRDLQKNRSSRNSKHVNEIIQNIPFSAHRNQQKNSKSIRSRKQTYEQIKNIPLPTNTEYNLKYLHEPYKSYYMNIIKKSDKSVVKTYTSSYNMSKKKPSTIESAKNKSYQEYNVHDSYIVDTFNEGYCISNEKFEEIKRRLNRGLTQNVKFYKHL